MESEKKPSEPVRLEVEVLIDAIDAVEEGEDEVSETESRDAADADRTRDDGRSKRPSG